MKKNIFSFGLIFLISMQAFSQIQIGEWRDHFSFRNITLITEADNQMIAATNNGIFYLDKETANTYKLTKANGLSDVDISAIKYFNQNKTLIIGYANGNLDIITDNKITNIPDIKNKNISGDKTINEMIFYNNYIYLACGFGVVKLDLQNNEIIETYYVGENSSLLRIYDIKLIDNNFWLATENGIYSAQADNQNLINYTNWQKQENVPDANGLFLQIINFQNKIYALQQDQNTLKKNIYRFQNNQWTVFQEELNSKTVITANDERIVLTNRYEIRIYDKNEFYTRKINQFGNTDLNANKTFLDSQNQIWVADQYAGLVKENDDLTYSFYGINGIFNETVSKIASQNGKTIATRGGFRPRTGTNLWYPGTLYSFEDNYWSNISEASTQDYYAVSINPNDDNNFFIGSWGDGVIEYQDGELVNAYNENNCPLQSCLPGNRYVRIAGMDFDQNNNLWVASFEVDNTLNVLKPDDTWQTFYYPEIDDKKTYEIVVSEQNIAWLVIGYDGIFALDFAGTLDDTNDDNHKKFYPSDENSELIGQEVKCVAEDLDNNIWIGTNEGVGVIYNQQSINEAGFYVSRPKINAELNDTIITGYLLGEEVINAIAVDGANRKWFGTDNSGIYLMNEDGTLEIHHFTEKNSPLPSDKILSLAVDNKTGELFVVTDKGVVSYRTEATTGNDEFENVYVFPNPIRPEYEGEITITGLAENTEVKITDVAGNIVYQTSSLGGQAVWDGLNFSGKRVQTGVYLVFCSNADGSKTHVTKLLFIN